MLVVSRREDQDIVFPELGIRITILKTSSSLTRVGIEAPKHIRIIRGELEEYPVEQAPIREDENSLVEFEWTTT